MKLADGRVKAEKGDGKIGEENGDEENGDEENGRKRKTLWSQYSVGSLRAKDFKLF
jgi:hypothetical protein